MSLGEDLRDMAREVELMAADVLLWKRRAEKAEAALEPLRTEAVNLCELHRQVVAKLDEARREIDDARKELEEWVCVWNRAFASRLCEQSRAEKAEAELADARAEIVEVTRQRDEAQSELALSRAAIDVCCGAESERVVAWHPKKDPPIAHGVHYSADEGMVTEKPSKRPSFEELLKIYRDYRQEVDHQTSEDRDVRSLRAVLAAIQPIELPSDEELGRIAAEEWARESVAGGVFWDAAAYSRVGAAVRKRWAK